MTTYSNRQIEELRERIGANPTENQVRRGEKEVRRIVEEIGRNHNFLEISNRIFNNIVESKLTENHSIAELASASVYTACRKKEVPVSLSEVSSASIVQERERYGDRVGSEAMIGRVFRRICNEIGLLPQRTDPRSFVNRYSTKLDLPDEVRDCALTAIEKSEDEAFTAGSANSFAAGAIYFAMGEHNVDINLRELCQITYLSEHPVINNRDKIKQKK
ncbi:hypothetical protein DQW50_16535 [Halorubrum sp. 48-1-W]|uniref:transcription initiation factor IIB family protein n=1 Tax=Halorubrum sp. 48-1-W TaxID=2249761 RepID=UPI000DCDDCAE|nr:transcription initiation factor IIB family protein [Halorubrum sp. 48-1-W]RAW44013.1 hypothetical protein DQW50_16535 [Halorubrum sp. 48-1-W]